MIKQINEGPKFNNYIELSDRKTYKQKIKNNYEWVKRKADSFDHTFTHEGFFNEKFHKAKINYDMYNGRFDPDQYRYVSNPFNLPNPEQIATPAELRHYDIMSKIIKSVEGEEISKTLRPIAFGVNAELIASRARQKTELFKEFIYQGIMAPIAQQLGHEPSPEEVSAMAPPEIQVYMSKQFRLPQEMQTQHILNYELRRKRIKDKFDKGWKHSLLDGKEVYRIESLNGLPDIRLINGLFFEFGKSRDSEAVEDGEWTIYNEYLTRPEIYQRFGNDLEEKDMKILDETNVGWDSDSEQDWIYPLHRGMINFDYFDSIDNPFLFFEDRFIRVSHITWRSLKKIKFITTINPDTGMPERVMVDETYKLNPALDIEEEIKWIPESWEVTKIHANEAIYLRMGPCPNQFRDPHDIYSIKLPYFGVVYDELNSQSKPLFERGLSWQEIYNILMFHFEKRMALDKGNLVFFSNANIPDDMSNGEFLHYIVNSGFGFLDLAKEGTIPQFDAQVLKSINASNSADIGNMIKILEFVELKCFEAMFYNKNRLGFQSPYESVRNNQQNIIQSSNQTLPYFRVHEIVKEKVLTAYIEECRMTYRENPIPISYVLDDMSLVSLTMDPELLNAANYGVFISNSKADQDVVNLLRQYSAEIIQNTSGDLRPIMEILTSEDPMSIKNKVYEMYEDLERKQAAAAEAQRQQIAEENNAEAQEKEREREFKAGENEAERRNKREINEAKSNNSL